jgi:hypothetical protein
MNLIDHITFWAPFFSNDTLWQIIYWLGYAFGAAVIIFLFFCLQSGKDLKKPVKISLIAISVIILLSLLSKIGYIYLYLKNVPELGAYLVQGKSSYFITETVNILISLAWTVGLAAVVYIISIIVYKGKSSWFESSAPAILAICALTLQFNNFLIALWLGLLATIVFQVGTMVILKRSMNERVSILPFVLGGTILILLVSLFPFYENLLNILRLS